METITTITYRNGKTVTNSGTSGLTLTGRRNGEDVQVQIEFDLTTEEEATATIGTMLTKLEELHGEAFVAACIAHYAHETGKVQQRPGKRDRVVIRHRNKR
jgi:hypothetical protein